MTIGKKSQEVLETYLGLPYFNNRRKKVRGGLRVSKGKGTPAEIAEEAEIQAMQSRVDIKSMPKDLYKKFLVEHDLGVDCSGFAYHLIDAITSENGLGHLKNHLVFPNGNFIRHILTRLRPAENAGVSVFRDDKNSSPINPRESQPGDIIIFMGTGKDKTYNHILVIIGVDKTGDNTVISYAHSYAWPSDGLYNHGVRTGEILLKNTDTTNDILGAEWIEQGATGELNYTYHSARNATEVTVRRLNGFAKIAQSAKIAS